MTDLLDRIDALLACAQCKGPMTGSPSVDFCGPFCQEVWTRRHHDVTELDGYREDYSVMPGWDAAHYVHHIEVIGEDGTEWSLAAADARAWLECAREQATAVPVPDGVGFRWPGPAWVGVERTDDPFEDAQVAEIAALRTPYECDARRLRAFAADRLATGVADPFAAFAARVQEMVRSASEGFRALATSWEGLRATFTALGEEAGSLYARPMRRHNDEPSSRWHYLGTTGDAVLFHVPVPRWATDPPIVSAPGDTVWDPAARALAARRNRNTGPSVHADPRRNGRRAR